jgi:hypothetical protein
MAHRDANKYSWQRYRIENQTTQPLPTGNLPFRMYLSAHHLTSLDATRLSKVLYATTWNIEQNKSIRPEHAALVRAALRRVTGVAYTEPIIVHADRRLLSRPPMRDERRHNETI